MTDSKRSIITSGKIKNEFEIHRGMTPDESVSLQEKFNQVQNL
jgi:hypothetical protein